LDLVFLYDGWNLIAELNANASNAKMRTYLRGSDLSGTAQGAGGVGGLLKLTYVGTQTTNAFVAFDGNGNVLALVDTATGGTLARYEYGPFGEALRVSGSLAAANPIRFSTKYTDEETGLVYYGYRFYSPSAGCWLGRDPIEEAGGSNLYGFALEDPMGAFDSDGLRVYLRCRLCGQLRPAGFRCTCGWSESHAKILPPGSDSMPFAFWRSLLTGPAMGVMYNVREWKDTEWFSKYRAPRIDAAITHFKKEIEQQKGVLCHGAPLLHLGPLTVDGTDEHSEELQTQQQQEWFLGSYDFWVLRVTPNRACNNQVTYTAQMVIVDRYGVQDKHVMGEDLKVNTTEDVIATALGYTLLGPERWVILGRFTFGGTVQCCK